MKASNVSILQSALVAVNNFRAQIDQQAHISIDSLTIRLDGGGLIMLTWREDLLDWDVAIQ